MFTKITSCRACGNAQLLPYLDLNAQPPANSFHAPDVTLPVFPLELVLCRNCFLSQLSVIVDPDILFKHYLYVSGTSQTLRDYFDWFAKLTTEISQKATGLQPANRYVLDIACNDGSQLDAFKSLGWDTWGVDPAENVVPTALRKGHNVVTAFWGDHALTYIPKHVQFDIITAQNVFAHTDDILSFLKACQPVMHKKSLLFIQTSQSEMFMQNEFDTAYHEHLSFFNTLSMYNVLARAGMVLENVFKTNIHGTSYVFVISLDGNVMENSNVEEALKAERAIGLYDESTYFQFAQNAHRVVSDLRNYIRQAKGDGKTVVGYGAAAKGMTVLNFGKIELDYIVDDNPMKQGLLTPGMNIPVYASTKLFTEPDDVVIIPLAWNFYTEIRGRIQAHRPTKNDIYVSYFPKLVVTESL